MTFDPRRRMLTSLLFVAGFALLLATTVQAQGLGGIEREIGRLSGIAGGTVGVGIMHLETGRELYVNADEPFPMASTFKVPVAVQLLRGAIKEAVGDAIDDESMERKGKSENEAGKDRQRKNDAV